MSELPLEIVPLTIRKAKEFVEAHHRHHSAPQGALFAVGVARGDQHCGAAIVGRPVARALQDGITAEVTRCCTDGTRNACSKLYGACRRAARALGWKRLITYTLADEPGTSLIASGWTKEAVTRGGSWCCPSRSRRDQHPTGPKVRWSVDL